MSKYRDEIRNFLLYVEDELRDYSRHVKSCPDDGEISALLFMSDLADDIRVFLGEEVQA